MTSPVANERFGRLGRRVQAGARDRPAVAVLALVVGLGLWFERHLLQVASWPNDLPFHLSMVDWATGRFQAGTIPTDGWFPRLSGGLPQFHLYQSLPHLLTGLVGTALGAERAVHLALWLLVATWPISVYLAARALGLSALAATAAAVVAPLVRSATGYGFEPYSYLWIGNGLWSQAWGMWVAPLALGWTARAVREGTGYGRAVAAVALTVAFHLPTAWFVLVALGLWLVVQPGEWRQRLPRSLGLGALSVAASAWVLVPFLVDRWATNDSSFNGQGDFADSFGWRPVLRWVRDGDVLDHQRFPVLSLLALAGLVVALAGWRRARPGHREVVAVTALSLALFVGRNPLGPLIALLPGSSQVFLHRYVATLQLGLVLLAGLGVEAGWGVLRRVPPLAARPPALAAVAAVAVLALAVVPVRATGDLLAEDGRWVALQEEADAGRGRDVAELVALAQRRGGGRVYGGKLNDRRRSFTVGSVPAPIWLAHLPVDALGYGLRVSALAADLETYLDDASVAELDAFGIRYLLIGPGVTPPAGTWFLAARGGVQLWEVPGDGLVSAAHLLGPPLGVSRSDLAADLLPVLRAQGGSPTAVRVLDLEGRSPEPSTSRSGLDRRPGTLADTDLDLEAGRMDTTTDFATDGAVVVKANWNPRWHATVDGEEVDVAAVAPTWLAVPVPAGRHRVELRYRPWPWTPPLALLALGAVVVGWRWSRRGRSADPDEGEGPEGEDGGAGHHHGTRRRGGRWRQAAAGAAATVAVLATSCGTPHRLPDVGTAVAARSPLRGVELLRTDSFATLDRVIAPDRPTVLVVAGPDCAACVAALEPLAEAAAGADPYSLLVLGVPGGSTELDVEAGRLGLSRWNVRRPRPDPAAEQLGLEAPAGLVVVGPDGTIRARHDGPPDDDDLTATIEEATR